MKTWISVCMAVLLISSPAWGAGLAIPEQGAAAMGMSAAMTARSEDLSAIFYNPAGIDYVENYEVFFGLTPIQPSHTFAGASTSIDAEKRVFLPPQLYAAGRIRDNLVAGLGIYAPFGLGTDWNNTWNGRYTSTEAEIEAIYVNPTIAFRLNEMVSIGMGVSYVQSNAVIEKMVDAGLKLYGAQASYDTQMSAVNPAHTPIANMSLIADTAYDTHFALDGDGSGFGFNIGSIIRPTEDIQIGVSYRGPTDIDYEGKAKFTHSSQMVTIPDASNPGQTITVPASAALAASMPASQDGKATLHLPWMLNLGVLYDIRQNWDVSADFDFVGWSVYDELTIDFDDDVPADKQTMDKDWENSVVVRLGTSYDYTERIVGRAGFMYDTTPVPDYTFDGQLPDSDRIGLSLGAGYDMGAWRIDASYLYLSFSDRSKDNLVGYNDVTADGDITIADQAQLDAMAGGSYPVGNGDYESYAHLFSVALSYRF